MRKLSLRLLLIAAFSVPPIGLTAIAADLPIAPAEKPGFVSDEPWTGFYVGLHASLMFGGQIGLNKQFGNIVVGVEADASMIDVSERVEYRFGPFNLADGTGEASWLATVRGRLGYTVGRFLVYGTGGLAFTEVETEADIAVFGVDGDTRSFRGWTYGGGIEALITPNVTARIEYLYADFEKGTFKYHGGWFSEEVEFDAHIIRAGLNYKFGF